MLGFSSLSERAIAEASGTNGSFTMPTTAVTPTFSTPALAGIQVGSFTMPTTAVTPTFSTPALNIFQAIWAVGYSDRYFESDGLFTAHVYAVGYTKKTTLSTGTVWQ
jgi:hypothetical protein